MAIKIRCTQCQKKISIDEGFAGGVCRCPYCSGLVVVAGSQQASVSARPDSPEMHVAAPSGRPDSPDINPITPAAVPSDAAEARISPDHIPVARPVKVQGILAIVFIVGFIAMVIAVPLVVYNQISKPVEPPPPPMSAPAPMIDRTQGSPEGAPAIMGMELKAPVVFVMDAGASSRATFDYAIKMVRLSAASLKSEKFNLLLLTESENKTLSPAYLAGSGSDDKLKAMFEEPLSFGRTQLDRGLSQALDMKPGTLVLLTSKALDSAAIPQIAAKAKAQSTRIVVVILGSAAGSEQEQAMAELAKPTGGQAKAFSAAELDDWSSNVKGLD